MTRLKSGSVHDRCKQCTGQRGNIPTFTRERKSKQKIIQWKQLNPKPLYYSYVTWPHDLSYARINNIVVLVTLSCVHPPWNSKNAADNQAVSFFWFLAPVVQEEVWWGILGPGATTAQRGSHELRLKLLFIKETNNLPPVLSWANFLLGYHQFGNETSWSLSKSGIFYHRSPGKTG